MERRLILPYSSSEEIKKIKAGDSVLISGTLYVGRDQVHKRLSTMIEEGETLPFSFPARCGWSYHQWQNGSVFTASNRAWSCSNGGEGAA